MDWDRVNLPASPAPDAPSPVLVETSWRVRTPRGRVIICGIYRDDAPGFDVRVGFREDDLLQSKRTWDVHTARGVAARWRLAVLAKGFEEVAQ